MAEDPRAQELAAHYALCETSLREKDRDLWLAALYAPAARRKHFHALGAFAQEISEIQGKVTQPLLGEMRLRWWADAIETPATEGGARAHPIADALLDTLSVCSLDPQSFTAFLDAHVADFYDDPQPDLAALLAYCDETMAEQLRWSARVLGGSGDHQALRDAGAALGVVSVLRRLPFGAGKHLPEDVLERHGASRQDVAARLDSPELRAAVGELCRLAQARFEAARRLSRAADEPTRIALLPLAGLPLHLERMAARDYAPFRGYDEPSMLGRQWRLWRAGRRGI